jgi:hypothetical protein
MEGGYMPLMASAPGAPRQPIPELKDVQFLHPSDRCMAATVWRMEISESGKKAKTTFGFRITESGPGNWFDIQEPYSGQWYVAHTHMVSLLKLDGDTAVVPSLHPTGGHVTVLPGYRTVQRPAKWAPASAIARMFSLPQIPENRVLFDGQKIDPRGVQGQYSVAGHVDLPDGARMDNQQWPVHMSIAANSSSEGPAEFYYMEGLLDLQGGKIRGKWWSYDAPTNSAGQNWLYALLMEHVDVEERFSKTPKGEFVAQAVNDHRALYSALMGEAYKQARAAIATTARGRGRGARGARAVAPRGRGRGFRLRATATDD